MSEKIKLYIDLDGVCANFMKAAKAHPDYEKVGNRIDILPVFRDLELIPGAQEAINQLWDSGKFDMYFLSTAPWDNPNAWRDKKLWVTEHFPQFRKRLILTHHKDLLCGSENDILIDDRLFNGAEKWSGIFIHFGQPGQENWNDVLEILN